MSYDHKPGDGTLYKNTKATSDKAPSMSGFVIAHRDIKKGEKVRLAAWTKGGQDGKDKFLSLKMSDDRDGQQATAERPRQPATDPFD